MRLQLTIPNEASAQCHRKRRGVLSLRRASASEGGGARELDKMIAVRGDLTVGLTDLKKRVNEIES